MRLPPEFKGLLTYIPVLERVLPTRGTGGTNSATYCYGVWMKHLVMLWDHGLQAVPNTLAELGPGDSVGMGIAAMLSGVDNYFALDVVEHANTDFNLRMLGELVLLYRSRAARPHKGWPDFDDRLDDNLFPSHFLTEERLGKSLAEERISRIREAIKNPQSQNSGVTVKYMVPWLDADVIQPNSVDLVVSHSVLEHVVNLESTYKALHSWLKPAGMMSHQIDFSSHGLSKEWNGYRAYSELRWKVILGRRPYLINRQPCSVHVELLKNSGFEITCHLKRYQPDGIYRSQLSSYWQDISDDDLNCSGMFVQARKQ